MALFLSGTMYWVCALLLGLVDCLVIMAMGGHVAIIIIVKLSTLLERSSGLISIKLNWSGLRVSGVG